MTLLKRHGLLAVGGADGDAESEVGEGDVAEDAVAPALSGDRVSLSAV